MLNRFPHEGATWILPFQPRSYIHSQNSKTAHGIDERCPFLIGSTVVLRSTSRLRGGVLLGCISSLTGRGCGFFSEPRPSGVHPVEGAVMEDAQLTLRAHLQSANFRFFVQIVVGGIS
jgi:hypothetical protein